MAGQQIFQTPRLQSGRLVSCCVSSLYISPTAVLAIALLLAGWPWGLTLAAFELLIGIWLDQQVAVPFASASRN